MLADGQRKHHFSDLARAEKGDGRAAVDEFIQLSSGVRSSCICTF
jgi:hypothetical protein